MADTSNTPPDYELRCRIQRFGRAIDETRARFPGLHAYGRYPAAAPYREKEGIPALLDDPVLDPVARERLMEEYSRHAGRLCALERDLGEPYREQLRAELRVHADAYAAAVCHAGLKNYDLAQNPGPSGPEILTILVRELSKDTDLTEFYAFMRMIDAGRPEPDTGCDPAALPVGCETPVLHTPYPGSRCQTGNQRVNP